MRLDNRVKSLEEKAGSGIGPVIRYIIHEGDNPLPAKQAAIQEYCKERDLDPKKLEAEEYGEPFFLEIELISPGGVKSGDELES